MQNVFRSEDFLKQAMKSYGDSVYRVAVSQTTTLADADDVYQDVFLGLFKNKTNFENEEHLKAWLLRVTLNKCHDLRKSAAQKRNTHLRPEHDRSVLDEEADESDIWDFVATLPSDMRAVIHLHYLEGYKTDEIADIVECAPATVRMRLHRGREKLKELLSKQSGLPRKEGTYE